MFSEKLIFLVTSGRNTHSEEGVLKEIADGNRRFEFKIVISSFVINGRFSDHILTLYNACMTCIALKSFPVMYSVIICHLIQQVPSSIRDPSDIVTVCEVESGVRDKFERSSLSLSFISFANVYWSEAFSWQYCRSKLWSLQNKRVHSSSFEYSCEYSIFMLTRLV